VGIIGLKKNPKALNKSQIAVEDLPFPHKISMMNSRNLVLHRRILCHPSNKKHLP